jgi:glycine hydroxymethyltransferase
MPLMKAGEPFGMKACGFGARDSLRTEAGLPLYGHEMGGELNLGVAEAGFGAYVKVYKPWFIGRSAFMQREQKRKVVVARFRFVEKGVRMAHHGDPVLDAKGRVVGTVTSCAIDKEGFLTGQAVVDMKVCPGRDPVLIYQGAPKSVGKAPAELNTGDRFTLPSPANRQSVPETEIRIQFAGASAPANLKKTESIRRQICRPLGIIDTHNELSV